MSHKPLVIAGILLGFEAFLNKRHVDTAALFAQAGLHSSDLSDPQKPLPAYSVALLLEEAARLTGEPCLGVDWAEALPVGATGTPFYLFMNSTTVGEGIGTLARNAALLLHAGTINYGPDGDGATLWWRWPALFRAPTQAGVFAAALFVLRIRLVTSPDWTPVRVELQGPPLPCQQRAKLLFGSEIKFQSERNAIHIDGATAHKPIAQADARLRKMLQQLAGEAPAIVPAVVGFSGEVRNIITILLPDRRATLDEVARALACSPRTLQNRLAQASTSFESLLNDIRRTRADNLLTTSDQSMSRIATELGFSELSAFTRAAQRWFGMSPSAYRKNRKT